MPPPPTRPPYTGPKRKLVLAFDIGTTYSGISYSLLDPGEVPVIKPVTRFPSQIQTNSNSKIPTIIYYDKRGKVRAVGAEAVKDGIEDQIEDEGWIKAEWFKLHLRPKPVSSSEGAEKPLACPLPKNKSVVDVFADFMAYLYRCARTYIQESYVNTGSDFWASVEQKQDIEFVLSHPNGWGGAEQAQMRSAATQAGLVPDTSAGRARIHFVTEGEASLHFCIQSGLMTTAMEEGEGVLIVDAGGGTIDISTYSRDLAGGKSSFQELNAAACFFQGSIYVTHRAKSFLNKFLQGSRFQNDVNHIARQFDQTAKLTFRDKNESQYVKFGSARDKDLKLGIRSGQLKLAGTDVASFFEPSVNQVIDAIQEQRRISKKTISSVFLVGGFAASDWLFSQIENSLQSQNINFCRPEGHTNKAVADGGVSFYIDHFVTSRVAKYSYGVPCYTPLLPFLPEHMRRINRAFIDPSGTVCIDNQFSVILPKDTQVSETKEFRCSYHSCFPNRMVDRVGLTPEILCYKGASTEPRWMDEDKDNFQTLCRIAVDASDLENVLVVQRTLSDSGPSATYYELAFDIILTFGLTELGAQVCWTANGQEHRSPVKIIYDDLE